MTIVVTGASAGVGRATVRAFARPGARIALLARGRSRLEEARAEVEAAGGEAMVMPVDVSDADAVEAAAAAAEERFGPIDLWINNAMVSVFSPVKEMRAEENEALRSAAAEALARIDVGGVRGQLAPALLDPKLAAGEAPARFRVRSTPRYPPFRPGPRPASAPPFR